MPKMFRNKIKIKTERRTQLVDITAQVENVVRESGCDDGVCYVYVSHTTAGVIVNEGYDPDVARDIEVTLDRLVPREGDYCHDEGNSDAHIKTALTSSSAVIFIEGGKLLLGRWQKIFFCEFDGPRHREIWLKVCPDAAG
jgi:secondary thiamine-phosphate synthase enzyme